MRHWYLIFSVIFIAILSFLFWWQYESISKDNLLFGMASSLIGAVIGGLIGGLGSYYGGINGAKLNTMSTLDLNRIIAIKNIARLLNFTYIRFEQVHRLPENIMTGKLIYDNNWTSYLGYLDHILSDDEIRSIVEWFEAIVMIEKYTNEQNQISSSIANTMLQSQLERIKKIKLKLEQSSSM
ncbi:hypothetical protein P5G62_015240 [Neobacillus sp. 179-C4.2 HS]|uniref:Uncharacterized protein n=1 Tax=Neobacillus driksii TaxID=3035913 RepID=A0ABV4YUD8_9BACI|nr:hypothetical protein [Neobacillus sp. 179.-C4.2 HS]MDP5192763.1 hypothetical protein [Neobacillus sp. 179.-C4.2 HS]